MIINSVGDIMIHLKRIKNFDCFGFGNYKLKIEIVKKIQLQKGQKTAKLSSMTPYLIPEKPFEDSRPNRLPGPMFSMEDQVYHSPTFMFRAHNDEIELNEIVIFKFEKGMDTDIWDFEIRFSMWIYFGDNSNLKSQLISHH